MFFIAVDLSHLFAKPNCAILPSCPVRWVLLKKCRGARCHGDLYFAGPFEIYTRPKSTFSICFCFIMIYLILLRYAVCLCGENSGKHGIRYCHLQKVLTSVSCVCLGETEHLTTFCLLSFFLRMFLFDGSVVHRYLRTKAPIVRLRTED